MECGSDLHFATPTDPISKHIFKSRTSYCAFKYIIVVLYIQRLLMNIIFELYDLGGVGLIIATL